MNTNRPLFWIIFALLSLLALFAARQLAPGAFPLISTEIAMDRSMAVERAAGLAERFDWGSGESRSATSYRADTRAQYYIELEAGGVDAFRALMTDGRYEPYTWRVRRFREQSVEQVEVRFTPAGRPYGFTHRLPEDRPGAALPATEARSIGESLAAGFWQVALEDYELIESSDTRQPGGRVDHSFIYQRTDGSIGEADIRLRLAVSGDRLSGLRHFLHVPEGFERRFGEMRADNNTLFNLASGAMFLVFVGGGCVGGLLYLLRRRAVLWRPPLHWGAGIAALNLAVLFNAWPLHWMAYDTALSLGNHISQILVGGLLNFLMMAVLLTVVLMAAESLSRMAFPGHLQFWKLWRREAVSTRQVLGLTLAAFLLVGVDLFYVTGTYTVASRTLGWWYPSNALVNPDIMAQYFPWLTALVQPLQAAVLEEALFRAVPISAAVLLGRRFGGSSYWIMAAFLLQAVLFGAAHANYPQMPFYARTLELIPMALLFGAIFYWWGLLPAILLHFWYNVVWFALPVFASDAPGSGLDQGLIVVLALLPFWVILAGRLVQGRLAEAPASLYNRAWRPATGAATASPMVTDAGGDAEKGGRRARTGSAGLAPGIWRGAVVAGLAGLALLALFRDLDTDAGPLEVTREDAVSYAREQLALRAPDLSDDWQPYANINAYSPSHVFVWREAGPQVYEELLDSYLHPLRWDVRFVNFQAPVEERAEQYRFRFDTTEEVRRFRMSLPEDRPGARLSETEARSRALTHATEVYGVDAGSLEPVSASETRHPERSDWTVVFSDTRAWPLEEGDARIRIRLSGDRLAGYERYVQVPEEWQRSFDNWRATSSTVAALSMVVIGLVALAGVVLAIIRWSRGRFHVPAFAATSVGIAVLMLLDFANAWPATVYQFSTTQPFMNQVLMSVTGVGLGAVFTAVPLGMLAGLLGGLPAGGHNAALVKQPLRALVLAAGPVLLGAGALALLTQWLQEPQPAWGGFVAAASWFPSLGRVTNALLSLAVIGLALGLLVAAADWLTDAGSRRRTLSVLLFLVAGLVLRGPVGTSVVLWLASGLLIGLLLAALYWLVLRHHRALVIPVVATAGMIQLLNTLVTPAHPGAATGAALALLLVAVAGWFGYRYLETRTVDRDSLR